MTAEALESIEFRCNNCWQTNYAPVNSAGASHGCAHCQTEMIVPEATPERVRSAPETTEVAVPIDENPYANLSEAELMDVVKGEHNVPFKERDFQGYPNASLFSRFGASFIDGIFMMLAFAFGLLCVIGAAQVGLVDLEQSAASSFPDPTAALLFYFPFLVSLIIQWNLITTRGQTIGKFIFCIRIVSVSGRLPGFLMGVVVRNWLRVAFSLIPFFSLVDLLVALGDQRRCIHDYMAGTRVIQG